MTNHDYFLITHSATLGWTDSSRLDVSGFDSVGKPRLNSDGAGSRLRSSGKADFIGGKPG